MKIIRILEAGEYRDLISRSQARRVLARCEHSGGVTLDFKGIDFMGRGFADEIFRVYHRLHPEVEFVTANANDQILSMIRAVQAGGRAMVERN